MSDISGKILSVGPDFSGNARPGIRHIGKRLFDVRSSALAPPFTGAHQTERTKDVYLLTTGGLISVEQWMAEAVIPELEGGLSEVAIDPLHPLVESHVARTWLELRLQRSSSGSPLETLR
jgi:hypothetical protein